jgi:hypothetical protein
MNSALATEGCFLLKNPHFSAACLAAEVRFSGHVGRSQLFPRLSSPKTIGKTYLKGYRVCVRTVLRNVDRSKSAETRAFPIATALMLCIRARLQSGRKGPTKIRALAPAMSCTKCSSGPQGLNMLREKASLNEGHGFSRAVDACALDGFSR